MSDVSTTVLRRRVEAMRAVLDAIKGMFVPLSLEIGLCDRGCLIPRACRELVPRVWAPTPWPCCCSPLLRPARRRDSLLRRNQIAERLVVLTSPGGEFHGAEHEASRAIQVWRGLFAARLGQLAERARALQVGSPNRGDGMDEEGEEDDEAAGL